LLWFLCLAATPHVLAQSKPANDAETAPLPEDRGNIDPFADELITRVASYLAESREFALTAEISWEQLLDSGHKIQLSRSTAIRVRRPDRLRADVHSDRGELRFMYDGRTLSMHDVGRNSYAIIDAADNIDDMVDEVKARFDVGIPLVDLLVSDVRENYVASIDSATYVGLHRIAGKRHHHLLLSNENVDYQLWVEDGPDPLPRKIVVTHPNEPGVPQQIITITGWDFRPRVPDVVFQFNPPVDADEIDLQARAEGSE
jgi:hypothetical protein